MKFRMAEKSLFAILLRSPWWISLALAAVIALAARLALPADLVAFGVMGGFPFLVIAVLAARRQWRAPGAARVRKTLEAVSAMGWREFSAALEQAWRAQGYSVARREGGADFSLEKGGGVTLVNCKRWKAASLGVETLRELQAAMARAEAREGLCIALGEVTPQAGAFAKEHGIRVLRAADLAQLLRGTALGRA